MRGLWATIARSCGLALGGAEIICQSVGLRTASRCNFPSLSLIKQLSRPVLAYCGYVYASGRIRESSTDLVFDGKDIVCENGTSWLRATAMPAAANMP